MSFIYRAPFDHMWSPFSINKMHPHGKSTRPTKYNIRYRVCSTDGLHYIVLITRRSKCWLKRPVNPHRPIQTSDEVIPGTNRHLTLVVCYFTTTLHHDSRQHSTNITEHFRSTIDHPTMIVSITRTGWLRYVYGCISVGTICQ